MIKKYFLPDRMLDSYRALTPEFLRAEGIDALICDIDNTLATYGEPDPSAAVAAWCRAMNDAGIKIAFVSNNQAPRVERFNQSFGYPAFPKSGKPKTGALTRAMAAMGTSVANTALLGDQILTDALAAKRCGLRVFIVEPIEKQESLFFRCKRRLEGPVIRKYRRLEAKAARDAQEPLN